MYSDTIKRSTTIALLGIAVMLMMLTIPVMAGEENQTSSPVYWWWDDQEILGSSKLIRGDSGLNANFQTSGLPAGQAVTLWFIIFNNPAGCSTSPCSIPADVFNPAAQADFLWGAGRVTGESGNATFAGRLEVGDTSGSGMPEIGFPELALGLTNPHDAEVHLALHSHGPALTGQALKEQLNSFTGGCTVFLGPNGFAAGPADIPANVGECTTFQVSIHE